MNILFLTTHFNTGGISMYIKTLAREFKKEGHGVFVVSSGGDMVEDIEKCGVIHQTVDIRAKSELSWKIYSSLGKISRFIQDNNIDIIHAHTRVTQVMGMLLSKITKRHYVSTCHGFFKARFSRKLFPCWGESVVAISKAVKDHLIKDLKVPEQKVVFIRNGLDIEEFPFVHREGKERRRKELGLKNVSTVGIIARLSDVKGHRFLIEAMQKVICRFPRVQLIIVGQGKEEQVLKNRVRELHLEEFVCFLPVVNRTSDLLCAMDIFVMPSLQEGLGLSVMEAQASGLPVVTSRVGGLVSLVQDGQTGLLVEPQDVNGLARAIVHLLENEKESHEMGRRAREFIQEECSAKKMASKTADLYHQLTEAQNLKNILVMNVNWLGDVIFSSPVFKALKTRYPDAKITCLSVPRVTEILKAIVHADEIIEFDEKKKHWSPLAKWKLIRQIQKKHFDAVFILHRSLTRAFIAVLGRIPQRIGYATKNRGFLLTHKARRTPKEIHRSDYYLNILESFGISVKDRICELNVDDSSKRNIRKLLEEKGINDGGFLVALNAGGNWDLKRWPLERFSLLADRLKEQFNAQVIIPGAKKDVELAKRIYDLSQSKPVLLTETTLSQLLALLQRVDLLISADTGPLHMASSVGTDVIGIFGPTRPEITGPRGKGRIIILQRDVGCNRQACYKLDCSDNICMQAVEVEEVLREVRRLHG